MKRVFAVLLLLMAVTACDESGFHETTERVDGDGILMTESRSVSGFDRIVLAGEGQVIVTQGGGVSLTIEAEENLLPYIVSDLDGNVLRIRTLSGYDLEPTQPIVYRIGAEELRGFDLTGAGSFTMSDLRASDFSARIMGAGSIDLENVDVVRLDALGTGAGSFEISGVASALDVDLTGAVDFHGFELMTEAAEVAIPGSGSAEVFVMEVLDASIPGSGTVVYKGDPTVVSTITGIGSIEHFGG